MHLAIGFASRIAHRPVLLGLVLASALGFALGNCGGSSSSTPPGGLNCPGNTAGNCTAAQLNQYADCLYGQCGSSFQACYGPNFRSGTIGGACATYGTCVNKCGCNDAQCSMSCGVPGSECQSCLGSLSSCVLSSTCVRPACSSGSGSGGSSGGLGGSSGAGQGGMFGGVGGNLGGSGATCADLLNCCNAIADAATKASCLSAYNSIRASGDATCGIAVAQLRTGGTCL